jgi:hypothetical protein
MKHGQQVYCAKSMERDFVLKTLKGHKKVSSQSIENIVAEKKILPNTYSFGHKKRLACSLLHKNYTKTYRGQGVIFRANTKPDYVAPFDLSLLIRSDAVVTQYYRIENNLHIYYNFKLIPGFEAFVSTDISKQFKQFPSPQVAWEKVNDFRVQKGYSRLPKTKKRLASYNEVIFYKPVDIEPVAIFGYSSLARKKARELKLPHFRSAKKFYESVSKN